MDMRTHFYCQHLSLPELRAKPENRHHSYLFNDVPAYPRPELHVSHLSHCTALQGLRAVKRDSGFRNPGYRTDEPKVVWFSLTVSPTELSEAEGRDMKIVYPDGAEESISLCNSRVSQTLQNQEHCDPAHSGAQSVRTQGSLLLPFASSSAFESCSRLGSFRFTFPLQVVLDKYSQQFCEGQQPVMRVWKTTLYRNKVEYVVLVHGSTSQDWFSELPLLQEEADSICAFRTKPRPHFIWRPQAMSGTHSFELLVNRKESTLMVEPRQTHDEFGRQRQPCYYVWDCVALALYVSDETLRFEDMELRASLRYCETGGRPFRPTEFQTFEEAQTEVQNLWPLERFSASQFNICH